VEKLKSDYNDFFNNPKYIYKVIGSRYLIILSKLEDSKTDEDRNGIVDKTYALYLANKLFVEKIIDMYKMTECNEVTDNVYIYEPNKMFYLKYVAGEIIKKIKYHEKSKDDPRVDIVYNVLLNYHKTIVPAYFYSLHLDELIDEAPLNISGLDGTYAKWYDNGQKELEYKYVKGIFRKREEWNEKGQKVSLIMYDIVSKYIIQRSYYDDGKLKQTSIYSNGKVIQRDDFDEDGNKINKGCVVM